MNWRSDPVQAATSALEASTDWLAKGYDADAIIAELRHALMLSLDRLKSDK